jgi:cbb3-type cytochrome oxidase subunit 1
MYLKHVTSLQFLTYITFLGVVVMAVARVLPGRAPPLRSEPYDPEELAAHDSKLAKYFMAGAAFLLLGSLHMVVKNLPWIAEWEAHAGYAGHLVRDLSNTHVMIVGGGTLIATGLTWYVLPRVVGRPLASNGLAQAAFWFTAAGLLGFYVALIANGIAMGHLVEHGWDYQAAKQHMGDWYRVPVGASAGVMGIGYWCFAANVALTIFQGRLVRVPKPNAHLSKFLLTGAAALTAGTVQGVIQVQPKNAEWLYAAGHAGEWIDPISHAHINLVTGLTMLVAGGLLYLAPLLGGTAPPRHLVNRCFFLLLAGSLAFYDTARAGGRGDSASSVPADGRGSGDAGRVLDAALARGSVGVEIEEPGPATGAGGLRSPDGGHAPGPHPGVPRGQRAARQKRRRR